MALSVKALQEKRAPIAAKMRKLADTLSDSKPDFTAEERAEWERMDSDFITLTRQIEVARRSEQIDEFDKVPEGRKVPGVEGKGSAKRAGQPDAAKLEEMRAIALQAWARRQSGMALAKTHRRACKALNFNPSVRTLDFKLGRESRALGVSTPALGGNTVPQGFVSSLEKALKAYNGVRQVANVMRTDNGVLMPYPTLNDTANQGELIGEGVAVAEQDTTFGAVNFNAFKYSSRLIRINQELLEDSAFDMGAEIGSLAGERIGRIQEAHFTTGTGTGQPQGIVPGSAAGVAAASATAISADDLINLQHSVDPAYRNDPSCAYMMSDGIFSLVRRLKDSQGRWLYEQGINGAPDRVHGKPVVINVNMAAAPVATAISVLFGPFSKYKIRDVRNIRLRRLEERYADTDQVGFVAFMRSDGRVLNAGTSPIRRLTH